MSQPSSHATHGRYDASTSGVQEDNIDVRGIFGFGIGLAVITVVACLLMLWMYHAEVAHVDALNSSRVYPLAAPGQEDRRPPIPRLQDAIETAGPKEALKELHAEENAQLEGYSWVDRNNNIVRIPIADAMKLTLQRGLPSRPQTGGEASAAAAPTATQEKK